MKTKDLYQAKNTCCGCELCAQLCPKSLIKMEEDEEGFLYPVVEDDTDCIECKRCVTACPAKKPGRLGNTIKESFSFSLHEDSDLKRSASGGLATAISREFIKQGGVVYGVGYSEDYRIIRYNKATKAEELERFRGSKYVQASKGNVYQQVMEDLKEGNKVLFVGLPCEVSALYHAVNKTENLFSISLICHGPTSQKVHRDYCKSLPKPSDLPMTFFSVRYKKTGWKPYYIFAKFADGSEFSEVWTPSDYGMAFLYLKRPSCQVCKYKAENNDFGLQADMVIGDFHGVSKESKQYNSWGVSQGSILTEKGKFLSSIVQDDYELCEIPYSRIRVTNRGLFMPIPQRGSRKRFLKDYLGHSLHYACHTKHVRYVNKWRVIKGQLSRIRNIGKLPHKLMKRFNRLFN